MSFCIFFPQTARLKYKKGIGIFFKLNPFPARAELLRNAATGGRVLHLQKWQF